jgi:glycosyltransferase involved in cell wall biosynthesis
MYHGKKVSIVLPVYNERENIRNAITDFLGNQFVDEVVAVDNNSTDGSAEEIRATKARYVQEGVQGYGAALIRGMREAAGDLIVTCEPDGTFRAADLERFLIYSTDYDVVLGSRTSRHRLWSGGDPGVNMDLILRLGNSAVAKLLQLLFNGPAITDVGCTYKLINRDAYRKIKDTFTVTGSHFSPEYMIRVLLGGLTVVEIPVHYGVRIGISKVTGNRWRAVTLGFEMIFFLIWTRVKNL